MRPTSERVWPTKRGLFEATQAETLKDDLNTNMVERVSMGFLTNGMCADGSVENGALY